MVLPKNVTCLLFLIRFHIMAIKAVTVVVFIPPPVPEGEAPMYMRKIMTNRLPVAKLPNGTVLNPTVVSAVMVWKKEAIQRCPPCPSMAGSKK